MEWTAEAQENNGVLRVKLSLTHEELAQLIGYSRESVSRSLGEFRRQRLLELNGSTLLVHNKAALESLAAISSESAEAVSLTPRVVRRT